MLPYTFGDERNVLIRSQNWSIRPQLEVPANGVTPRPRVAVGEKRSVPRLVLCFCREYIARWDALGGGVGAETGAISACAGTDILEAVQFVKTTFRINESLKSGEKNTICFNSNEKDRRMKS